MVCSERYKELAKPSRERPSNPTIGRLHLLLQASFEITDYQSRWRQFLCSSWPPLRSSLRLGTCKSSTTVRSPSGTFFVTTLPCHDPNCSYLYRPAVSKISITEKWPCRFRLYFTPTQMFTDLNAGSAVPNHATGYVHGVDTEEQITETLDPQLGGTCWLSSVLHCPG